MAGSGHSVVAKVKFAELLKFRGSAKFCEIFEIHGISRNFKFHAALLKIPHCTHKNFSARAPQNFNVRQITKFAPKFNLQPI